uniref:CSON006229 protein n=1 Tax=Culicoides sonorensis TaxID=179676 RepID=A0A336L7H5_CULSO
MSHHCFIFKRFSFLEMETIAVEIFTDIGKGYITEKGICFLNAFNGLEENDFKKAIFLLENIESMLKFDPDQKLIDLINVKYEKFIDYHRNWKSLDDLTKKKFAEELLFGDKSIENLIRRFVNKAYEQGGYVDQTIRSIIKNIVDEKEKKMVVPMIPTGDPYEAGLQTYEHCENMKKWRKETLIKECEKAVPKFNEFYQKLLSVEYKATTLILFGYVILLSKSSKFSKLQNTSPKKIIKKMKEMTDSDKGFKFRTEIEMALEQHEDRLYSLKEKMNPHRKTLDPYDDPIGDQGVEVEKPGLCIIL